MNKEEFNDAEFKPSKMAFQQSLNYSLSENIQLAIHLYFCK